MEKAAISGRQQEGRVDRKIVRRTTAKGSLRHIPIPITYVIHTIGTLVGRSVKNDIQKMEFGFERRRPLRL
jgi:hypothetical protein